MQEKFDYIFQRLCHVHGRGYSKDFSKTFFESLIPCDFEILNLAVWEFRTKFDKFPNPAQVNEKIRQLAERQTPEPAKDRAVQEERHKMYAQIQKSVAKMRMNFMLLAQSEPEKIRDLLKEMEIFWAKQMPANGLKAPEGYLLSFLESTRLKDSQKDFIFEGIAGSLFDRHRDIFDLINY